MGKESWSEWACRWFLPGFYAHYLEYTDRLRRMVGKERDQTERALGERDAAMARTRELEAAIRVTLLALERGKPVHTSLLAALSGEEE